jgi:DNA-binding MarR family transcriptional regulator
MTNPAQRGDASVASCADVSSNVGQVMSRPPADVLTLDELLAEPMVQQLMRRDRTDEATIRLLWQRMALARPAARPRCMPPPSQGNDVETIARVLREIAGLWRKRCNRAVRARLPGMTWARCAGLIHLARSGAVRQAALADSLGIRPMTLVRLLDRLEADGLITRLPDLLDRRAHLLALTAKALPVIERIYEVVGTIEDESKLGLSGVEARQLRVLLCRLRATLAAGSGEGSAADPAPVCGHA